MRTIAPPLAAEHALTGVAPAPFSRAAVVNLGIGPAEGKVPHLVGRSLLAAYGLHSGSREAHAFSHLEFLAAARSYGKVGGLLPGEMITRERLMEQTAITYPNTAVSEMTGVEIKEHLEKLCDKIFNPDPYQHQGGDMVRTGGLAYACEPGAPKGSRVRDMVVNGQALEPDRSYKVARWGVGSSPGGSSPIWDVVEAYLRGGSSARVHAPNVPRLIGVATNPGYDPRME